MSSFTRQGGKRAERLCEPFIQRCYERSYLGQKQARRGINSPDCERLGVDPLHPDLNQAARAHVVDRIPPRQKRDSATCDARGVAAFNVAAGETSIETNMMLLGTFDEGPMRRASQRKASVLS